MARSKRAAAAQESVDVDNVEKQRQRQRPTTRVPVHGHGALLTGGVPGNKGGPGRPPDAWKAKMAELADRWRQALEAKRVLDDPDHEHFMAAGKFVAEQAHGQAAKRLEVAGDAAQPLEILIRREG